MYVFSAGPEGVVHAVAPGGVVADPVGRIGREQPRFRTVEQAGHVVGIGGVTAQQSMVAQDPQIAELGPGCTSSFLERLIEIEALDPLALLASLKRAQQIGDLVLAEARQRQIDLGRGLQLGQKAGQQSVVPGA